MYVIRRWIKYVFGFSRRETNGFIILVPLTVLAIFSEPLYRLFHTNAEPDFVAESKVLDSLVQCWEEERALAAVAVPAEEKQLTQQPFVFDPNTVSERELQQLGFSPKIAVRMIHYREKGGKFITKSDLLAIYGLDSLLYKKLYHYIALPDNREITPARVSEKKKPVLFDINEADTSALVSVYGIGPVLACRVLKFRDALGGFVYPEQLFEVYGLDSATVQELLKRAFIREDFEAGKLDLNNASEQQLSAHPYISKSVAKAIVAYRFQHGMLQSVSDLRKIHLIDEQTFLKIVPYVAIRQQQ